MTGYLELDALNLDAHLPLCESDTRDGGTCHRQATHRITVHLWVTSVWLTCLPCLTVQRAHVDGCPDCASYLRGLSIEPIGASA